MIILSTEFQSANLCWTVSKKTGNKYLANLKGRGEGKLFNLLKLPSLTQGSQTLISLTLV